MMTNPIIRVGDKVEVFQKTSQETLASDVGIKGTVIKIEWGEIGEKIAHLGQVDRNSRGGNYFAYADLRHAPTQGNVQ